MQKLRPYLFYCLAIFSGGLVADEVRYYDIEVIIFEALDQDARISEVWKHELTLEKPPQFVELGQPYPGPIPKIYNPKLTFKPLHNKYFQLKEQAKLLSDNRNYRILLHTAWRQPGMESSEAIPVHIQRSFIQTTAQSSAAKPPSDPDMPAVNLPAPAPYTQTRNILDGYIKIILSRYLHADLNLTYTTNIPVGATRIFIAPELDDDEEAQPSVPQTIVYHLMQTRKMRSKEVHYIDHPVIGAIILATPYEVNGKKN